MSFDSLDKANKEKMKLEKTGDNYGNKYSELRIIKVVR